MRSSASRNWTAASALSCRSRGCPGTRPRVRRSPAPPPTRPRRVEAALAGSSDPSRAGHRKTVQCRTSHARALGLRPYGTGEQAIERCVDVGAIAALGSGHRQPPLSRQQRRDRRVGHRINHRPRLLLEAGHDEPPVFRLRRTHADRNASRSMCACLACSARRSRSATGSTPSGSTSRSNRSKNARRALAVTARLSLRACMACAASRARSSRSSADIRRIGRRASLCSVGIAGFRSLGPWLPPAPTATEALSPSTRRISASERDKRLRRRCWQLDERYEHTGAHGDVHGSLARRTDVRERSSVSDQTRSPMFSSRASRSDRASAVVLV